VRVALQIVALSTLVGLGLAGNASAQVIVTNCQPVEVASLENRIHVRCATATSGGIVYFALGTKRTPDESAFALRSLSLASTALVSGRGLAIRFDASNTTGAAIGCLANDCRLIETIYLR